MLLTRRSCDFYPQRARNGVKDALQQNYIIRNYMMEFLSHYIPMYIEEHREKFGLLADSHEFALRFRVEALNLLPSRYVTTPAGEVFSSFEMKLPQHSADLTAALTLAGDRAMKIMTRQPI